MFSPSPSPSPVGIRKVWVSLQVRRHVRFLGTFSLHSGGQLDAAMSSRLLGSVKIIPGGTETEKQPLISTTYLISLLDLQWLYGCHRLVVECQNIPEFSGFRYSKRSQHNLFICRPKACVMAGKQEVVMGATPYLFVSSAPEKV